MLKKSSGFRAVAIEFKHSSGAGGSRLLATEPGLYRLFTKAAGRSECATVLIGKRNEILEKSSGSQVRFAIAVAAEPFGKPAGAYVAGQPARPLPEFA